METVKLEQQKQTRKNICNNYIMFPPLVYDSQDPKILSRALKQKPI